MPHLVLPPEVVVELRRGLLVGMGTAADRLATLTLPGRLTHLPVYESSLWAIDATETVLEHVGVTPPGCETSVSLAEHEHPMLVYSVLRSRHELLESRRQDAAILTGERLRPSATDTLGQCVASIRQRLSGGPGEREERQHLVRSNTVR